VRTEEGILYLFVAIDRTSKFAYTELHAHSDRIVAIASLQALIKALPYKIHGACIEQVPRDRRIFLI
jgi:hypothetical protein